VVKVLLGIMVLGVLLQRLTELRATARNHRTLRDTGAVEHGAGHYPLFFLLHGTWLSAWPLEAWLRGPALSPLWPLWLLLLAAAEVLRYWTRSVLHERWTTRILVVPGEAPVRRGPYRFLRHPNYLAVVLELAAVPLLFGAWVTASITGSLNAALLLLIRIPAEEAAWKEAAS
jgi:methyltransferase